MAVAVFAFALAVRLWFGLVVHRPADFVSSDMGVYDLRASHLLTGELGPWDSFTPVGYPALLALLYAVSGKSLSFVAVVQAVLGAGIAAISHLLAYRITRSGLLALAASVLVAAHLPLVLYGGLLLSEVAFGFGVILGTWLLLRAADEPTWRRAVPAGLALGAAAVVRPNLLLFFPLVPLWAWAALRGARTASPGEGVSQSGGWIRVSAWIFAGALPFLLAAGIHNSRLLGKPAGLGSNGGLNFFLAHAKVRGAEYREGTFTHRIFPIPNVVRHHEVYRSPVPLYDEAHFYREGVRVLASEPSRLLAAIDNVVEGLGLGKQGFWPGWPGRETLLQVYAKVFFALGILPAAAWLLVLRRRIFEEENAPILLFAALLTSALLTLYFFLGDPRMRVPFDPLLIVLSVAAIDRAAAALASRKTAIAPTPEATR
ncbi:hypothetical protein AKJ08_0737 [Vulgatibacter incomptus]|uniref:ArnT-like N-terminal domain-containing protein n=2 Tax=Vulgatibacter incomptus TaxID=1391653 RepID=A0A0K1PA07_9BACT|nr:hypothetical protein AKJ08_0737 [Vulgatibacter incomptus]